MKETEIAELHRRGEEWIRTHDVKDSTVHRTHETKDSTDRKRRIKSNTSRTRKRSVSPLLKQRRKHHKSPSRVRSASAIPSLIGEVKRELGTGDSSTIISIIQKLKKTKCKHMATKVFLQKIRDLMQEFNPRDKKPSLHRIWKWLRRLLEEYMSNRGTPVLQDLQKMLSVYNNKDLIKAVRKLQHDNKSVTAKLNRLNFD